MPNKSRTAKDFHVPLVRIKSRVRRHGEASRTLEGSVFPEVNQDAQYLSIQRKVELGCWRLASDAQDFLLGQAYVWLGQGC